jgi:hypothetical protein
MLRSFKLFPNGSIAFPSDTSKIFAKVEFIWYKHKGVAWCAYWMPMQFGSSELRKPFVESAATVAWLPN